MAGADKEKVVAAIVRRLEVEPEYALELAERAEEMFLAETFRQVVPEKAFWIWVDLASAISGQDTSASGRPGGASGKVSSIKRGDTTIQFDHTSAEATLNLIPGLRSRIQSWRVVRAR